MKPSAFLAVFALAGLPAAANDAHHPPAAGAQASAAPTTPGEVRRIDRKAGKITLQHGPIENLGMPGMTMNFVAADPAFLDKVKVGDKVRFHAEQDRERLVVTAIEKSP